MRSTRPWPSQRAPASSCPASLSPFADCELGELFKLLLHSSPEGEGQKEVVVELSRDISVGVDVDVEEAAAAHAAILLCQPQGRSARKA